MFARNEHDRYSIVVFKWSGPPGVACRRLAGFVGAVRAVLGAGQVDVHPVRKQFVGGR